jgi:hypothetical protein
MADRKVGFALIQLLPCCYDIVRSSERILKRLGFIEPFRGNTRLEIAVAPRPGEA